MPVIGEKKWAETVRRRGNSRAAGEAAVELASKSRSVGGGPRVLSVRQRLAIKVTAASSTVVENDRIGEAKFNARANRLVFHAIEQSTAKASKR